MVKGKKQKNQRNVAGGVIESLKDIGGSTARTMKEDFLEKAPQDFMDQIFGPSSKRNFSGEITAGESLEIKEIYTGQREHEEKYKKQIAFERRLRQEESIRAEKKTNELRIQIQVIMKEVVMLSEKTQDLGIETKIAAMQSPIEPGVYHIIFFEKLLEFIKSFRKKVEEASVWLHATNKRAQKKNYWARYKKHGGKFLLSGEHYLTRSAG